MNINLCNLPNDEVGGALQYTQLLISSRALWVAWLIGL
jgi:hypothetical protein